MTASKMSPLAPGPEPMTSLAPEPPSTRRSTAPPPGTYSLTNQLPRSMTGYCASAEPVTLNSSGALCSLAKNDHPELAGGGCHSEDDLHGVVVHALHLGLDIVLVAVRAVDAHENVLGA